MEKKKIAYKIFSVSILVLMISLAVMLIGFRLVGFTPYSILSPSMTPKYPVGSLVYIKEVDTKDLKIGDDISFVFDEKLTVVTHQIVDIDQKAELFTTKGLANDSNDAKPVYFENIIGKVSFCIPLLGFISNFITSPLGLIISIAVILMWAIVIYIMEMKKNNKNIKSQGGVVLD